MKRFLWIALLTGLMILALTTVVSAQRPNPENPGPGRGGRMGGGQGWMHEYMFPILADKLGLTEAELTDLYNEGETFWTVAQSQGKTAEEAQQLMLDARSEALDKMVADGVITQEQADWMKDHHAGGRMGQGGGRGRGHGMGGCMGGGYGGGRGPWAQPGQDL